MNNIRKISIEDIEKLQDLSKSTFIDTFGAENSKENMEEYVNSTYSIKNLSKELLKPDSLFFFAEDKKRVMGYLKLNINSAQTEKYFSNSLEIERIYVLPEAKGQGIGKKFISLAEYEAKKLNVNTIWLGVWEKNYKALKFYEKMGFKVVDKHIFNLGNDKQTDLIMSKQIK